MTRREIPLSERTSWTVEEWAAMEGFSRTFGYRLVADGNGPKTYRAGRARRISREAAQEWRRHRERESAA